MFHHIPPSERPAALALIRRKLRPQGRLFLFENNPWNPGARWVMKAIPFDRVATMLSSRLVRKLPNFEQFELGRQLRRAARSVPANIVEGWAKRNSSAEFKRYLQVSIGSCDETRMWLSMCKDEEYISESE